jgi:hypothetical protein
MDMKIGNVFHRDENKVYEIKDDISRQKGACFFFFLKLPRSLWSLARYEATEQSLRT